jgi:poly(hydroxyalkanoate) depolymerase family esterase
MKTPLSIGLRQATQLVREQNIIEATRVIQRTLFGRSRGLSPAEPSPEILRALEPPADSDAHADAGEPSEADAQIPSFDLEDAATAERRPFGRIKRPLGEVLELLRHPDLPSSDFDPAQFARLRPAPQVPVPDGAAYLTRTFSCGVGSRDYKVYVPSKTAVNTRSPARPLIVMLHGCTQNPDDFAAGTGMNALAEEQGFVVAYPKQATKANQMACWNWFNPDDQMRDAGEPSLIAGITREIIAEFEIDATRVYVAGLSAGGAMAAIMSATYPEIYAATGVHSGLAYGSATDAASAFAVMSGASSPARTTRRKGHLDTAKTRVRTIVFHGAADQRVHPSNAEMILAEARAGLAHPTRETRHAGSAGGRAYTRTVIVDASGVPHVEHWAIEGLGHAWSGGRPEGSHTDRHGPDASREMLRFFLGSTASSYGQ